MNKTLKFTVLPAALIIVFFIVRLPASLVAHALPAQAALVGVEGSIWSGTAATLGISGIVSQEKLVWRFQPSALLHGKLGWQITSEYRGHHNRLNALLGFGHPTLEQVSVSLPLDPFMRFNSTIEGIRLSGTLMIQSERLAMQTPMRASIRVENLATAISSEATLLGSYQGSVEIEADGKGKLQINNPEGVLLITGGGSFSIAEDAVDLKLLLQPKGDLASLTAPLATLPKEGNNFVVSYKRP
jgi:general secretion pathway protein N